MRYLALRALFSSNLGMAITPHSPRPIRSRYRATRFTLRWRERRTLGVMPFTFAMPSGLGLSNCHSYFFHIPKIALAFELSTWCVCRAYCGWTLSLAG